VRKGELTVRTWGINSPGKGSW